MAVLALNSTELTDGYRGKPVNDHGKLRVQYFEIPAVAVAGDANTTLDLCDLPPGTVRIVTNLSRITTSAFGASRTLDVGHRAYTKVDPTYTSSTEEAENADAFIDGLDVSSAVVGQAWGVSGTFGWDIKYDLHSKAGVRIFATVLGGTIPVGATVSGFVTYVYE